MLAIFFIQSIRRGCEPTNQVWYYKIENGTIPKTENGQLPWIKLIDNFDAKYEYIANNDTEFFFCTTLNAPRKRLISIDISTGKQREIIAQHEKNVIDSIAVLGTVLKYSLPVKVQLHPWVHPGLG